MTGKSFAHYEIVDTIGAGGMGVVYRARDTQLGREVALKILPDTLAGDAERVARFEREAKLLASLNDPNIAAIHSIVVHEGRIGLALELVEGEDLAARLERGPIALEEALDIARQVASALERAHEQGIIHRDLKPANVRVTPEGTVKVLDFGLAKALDPEPGQASAPTTSQSPTMMAVTTQGGMILGTAAYMSPEQARGKPLDRRTDIFAFGTLLHEMLTGERAFGGDTVSDVLASVLKEEPSPDRIPETTPPAIRLLLQRCLQKDARQRLRDMGEARLILEAVQRGDSTASSIFGTVAASDGADQTTASGVRSGREVVAWVLVVLSLLAVGLLLGRSPETVDRVESPVRRLTVPLFGDSEFRPRLDSLCISPDGSRIAFVHENRIFLRRFDAWDALEVPRTEGAQGLFWSPDGSWLGFHAGQRLLKVRADGTQLGLVTEIDPGFSAASGGAWLRDDRIVYRGETDLMAVPAAGGEPTTFLAAADIGATDFHDPAAMHGGEAIVVIIHGVAGTDTAARVSVNGGLDTLITVGGGSLSEPCYSPSGHLLFVDRGDLWSVRMTDPRGEVGGSPVSVIRAAMSPSVSESGTLTYVFGAGAVLRQFVLVDRAGVVREKLGQPMDMWVAYALAPDGRSAAALDDNEDIWIHDVRGSAVRVTFTDIEHDMVVFSPDGEMVYFATGTSDNYAIARKSVARNEPEEVIVPPGDLGPHYYAASPALTSDGSRLFYTAIGKQKDQDLAWLDLTEGARPQRFLSSAAREFSPRPSPVDPELIAYVSDESGTSQVYLTTWPDAPMKLPVSLDGGNWPRWKGDGTEIYFARRNAIYAVDVNREPLRLGTPRLLFETPDYDDRQPFGWPAQFDVTADGERFLTTEVTVDSKLDPRIAIVENWAREFEN